MPAIAASPATAQGPNERAWYVAADDFAGMEGLSLRRRRLKNAAAGECESGLSAGTAEAAPRQSLCLPEQ
jgi:hypothetical protein